MWSCIQGKAKQKVLSFDVVPSDVEEWSTYEVPDDVLAAFKHELMASSLGITSQTIVRPAS